MTSKKISVVVPVKNGIATLERFIKGIQLQTLFGQLEVIIIDSDSTDGSVAYLQQFDFVKVVSIDPATFNHGATRNLAVAHCQGEFILMTVQDAWTTDPQLLERMHAHFKDAEVMGVCGQQVVPHIKGTNPHQWFRPQSEPSLKTVQFKTVEAFDNLSPKAQREACGWDDVIAMYRKTALVQMPFKPLIFGEDLFWAKMALIKGHKLVYDTACRVNHYHFEFPTYTYKRTLITKLFIYKSFGYFDDRKFNFDDFLRIIFRNFKWGCHIKWILHNFKMRYNYNRATRALEKHIENNTLANLEKELAIAIPIGEQKTIKNG